MNKIALVILLLIICFIMLYIVSDLNYLPYLDSTQLKNISVVIFVVILVFTVLLVKKIAH